MFNKNEQKSENSTKSKQHILLARLQGQALSHSAGENAKWYNTYGGGFNNM